jgi:EAL domain-containing protein (putative c-di-GMP-specific phosphodiesterase class I)
VTDAVSTSATGRFFDSDIFYSFRSSPVAVAAAVVLRRAGCVRRATLLGAAVQANTFLAQLLAAIQSGVADAMQELRAAGCSFALDDFGIGLSSFSYLRYLPIDYLKIEAGFVRDMIDDPMDCAIVDSIARIGHVLGIHTVAQGVDDVAIAQKLGSMGVDYAQGNQYGAPRPMVEAAARPERATPIPAMPLAPQSLRLGSGTSGPGGV